MNFVKGRKANIRKKVHRRLLQYALSMISNLGKSVREFFACVNRKPRIL
jgi:hypothetical protein